MGGTGRAMGGSPRGEPQRAAGEVAAAQAQTRWKVPPNPSLPVGETGPGRGA